VGLFSAFLAPRVKRLIGVELSASACQDFAVNLDEYDHVDLYQGAAEEILPALTNHPQGIVVDPPRTGLDKQALEAIIKASPEFIAYISCDPATLARDLRRLISAGFRLDSVTPFDFFPQTYHIESISLLSR
jgi:23S rRNA (uracil1939-C5)-methyltransferase